MKKFTRKEFLHLSGISTLAVVSMMSSGCGTTSAASSTTQTASSPASSTSTSTPDPANKTGSYSLDQCIEQEGFFIAYPDGSFNRYYGGYALSWESEYMTYGTEDTPINLRMQKSRSLSNHELFSPSNSSDCNLVIFSSNVDRASFCMVPITYSGYTLSRYNEEGIFESLFFKRVYGSSQTYTNVYSAVSGKDMLARGINVSTIGGTDKNRFLEHLGTNSPDKDSGYITFNATDTETYKVGLQQGTGIVETDYTVDTTYYIQDSAYGSRRVYPTLTPTTGGYSVFDFSGLDAGDYILWFSYWNSSVNRRTFWITKVTI